jgi:hypothetical protein
MKFLFIKKISQTFIFTKKRNGNRQKKFFGTSFEINLCIFAQLKQASKSTLGQAWEMSTNLYGYVIRARDRKRERERERERERDLLQHLKVVVRTSIRVQSNKTPYLPCRTIYKKYGCDSEIKESYQ